MIKYKVEIKCSKIHCVKIFQAYKIIVLFCRRMQTFLFLKMVDLFSLTFSSQRNNFRDDLHGKVCKSLLHQPPTRWRFINLFPGEVSQCACASTYRFTQATLGLRCQQWCGARVEGWCFSFQSKRQTGKRLFILFQILYSNRDRFS